MTPQPIHLDALLAHPGNSNVMSPLLLTKLAAHIQRSGRYPPLIVRPIASSQYQLLDGHHRAAVLRELGHTHAHCVVWEVDDAEALVLLATLNRLEGEDDPRKRASLITELQALRGDEDLASLAALLPEDADDLAQLARLHDAPVLRDPAVADALPVAIHFFVTPAHKRAIEAKLDATGLDRENALCSLLNLEDSP